MVYNIHHHQTPHGNIKEKAALRPTLSAPREGGGVDNPLPYADDSQAVTPSSADVPYPFDYNHLPVETMPTHYSNRYVNGMWL